LCEEDKESNQNKNEKSVTSKREAASRYPRYVDFIINAKPGDTKKEDDKAEAEENSSDKE
jgi:hypothetical protein